MSRRLVRSVLAFVLAFGAVPTGVYAAMEFGEVGYDVPGADDGREWVMLHNAGAEPVDLTGWKFFEEGVNHKLTPVGSAVVPPGGSAVIVQTPESYRADHPDYAGLVFKSSFSLKNTGETLSLKNASGTVMATVTYVPKPVAPKPKSQPGARTIVSTPTAGLPPPPMPVVKEDETAAVAAAVQEAGEQNTSPSAMLPWIGGVLAVVVVGIGAAFMLRPTPGREADEYHVTEDRS